MVRYAIVENRTGMPDQLLRIRTDLAWEALQAAVSDAVDDFLENGGTEADTALSATGGKFDWDDLSLWLPDRFQRAHGFVIEDATTDLKRIDGRRSLLPAEKD